MAEIPKYTKPTVYRYGQEKLWGFICPCGWSVGGFKTHREAIDRCDGHRRSHPAIDKFAQAVADCNERPRT